MDRALGASRGGGESGGKKGEPRGGGRDGDGRRDEGRRRDDRRRDEDRWRDDGRRDEGCFEGRGRAEDAPRPRGGGREDRRENDRRGDDWRGDDGRESDRRGDDGRPQRGDRSRSPAGPAPAPRGKDGQSDVWGRTTDALLPRGVLADPRAKGDLGKAQKAYLGLGVGTGRNTASFDARSTLVRPAMRIIVASASKATFNEPLKHDDVVIVPDFGCEQDDWSLYYKLVEEMTAAQQDGGKAAFIPWHEGAHLITKDPAVSKTFEAIQKKMGDFFGLKPNSRGSRFNWYKDSSDWKPFHHDSAAFNPQRARNQNCTVGISFGATRELAFLDANDDGKRVYFPQTNGMLFYFGRDVNIRYKHGVNFVEDHDGKGRISIILWGQANVLDEENSPQMLTDDSRPTYDGRRAPGARGGGGVCRDFARGKCDRGDGCRFRHEK
ncbi:hypothetical protein M885DRAFT_538268 [Pelagophyceae sp. CCMP2097]|nr:hypothetical protein M885DRAFT_538268 [Pelagophyceae sp. CCMP2097]